MTGGNNEKNKPAKPCFLIVDDDHQTVISVSSMLQPFGSRVDAANCGGAALNCLRETWYDVVITNLKIQGSNGHAFAQELKDTYPKITTIIMTEESCSEIAHKLNHTIADGCITKPFNTNNIKTVLNDIRQAD